MEGSLKILIAGDLLPSEGNISLFEGGNVKELFGEEICNKFSSSDFSIFNLEGPLTDSQSALGKEGPCIKAPVSTIAGIKALGVSAVALANNHIVDFGDQGYIETVNVLDKFGIQYVGAGKDTPHVNKYLSFSAKGVNICIYNVSETIFNAPSLNSAGANVYDEYVVCNDIRDLKKVHDYVIVLYHGGAEHFQYPTPQTRKRFHRMADCGADFITAQHTHCIGCEEYYNGSYLLYGQGNFLFARQKKYPSLTKEGLLSELVVGKSGITVNNYLMNIEGNVIRMANNQDLTSFYERGQHLNDETFILDSFKKAKSEEILEKCLLSMKGNFPLRKLLIRLFPNAFSFNGLLKSYSRAQCLRNLNMVQGDRRYEDMFYVWQYIMDQQNALEDK